ncbi:MAG TPA: fructosamine kinase family protein, partial [Flavitalea sp.]|nr:fructosamine kinase family protein [Flavitalea sp.]
FFCKINNSKFYPGMFHAERAGLATLAATNTVRVPACRDLVETGDLQCLLLEWIEQRKATSTFWRTFGESLAMMHSKTGSSAGFEADNYMGSLPQSNQSKKNWPEFFVEQRLQVQVRLAAENKLLEKSDIHSFERLYKKVHELMPDEPNVLLHGDLWSGNFLCDQEEQAVLFDPAVYYGLRHVDLAMTTLFGGFDGDFYEAYRYHSPLPSDYEPLWKVLNLYPLLIHLNLFGSSYRRPILDVLKHF